MQIGRQELKKLAVQNVSKAVNIFIPKKKLINLKNNDKPSQSLLDKKVKECFQKYYQVTQKSRKNNTNNDLNIQKIQQNKIFNTKILQNLRSKNEKQLKHNQKKEIELKINRKTNQKKANTEQYKSIKRIISKCSTNTIRNIKTNMIQQQNNYYQSRSKTLDNYQNEENNQEMNNTNLLGLLPVQNDYHINEYIMKKINAKKHKKNIPNSSYMFLNQRHKVSFVDHSQNTIQHIQMPIGPQNKIKLKANDIKRHLILKSNSNNKLIKRNKSYSKDKQIFSFLNLTPQNLRNSNQESFIQWNQIQKHQQFNTFSHKKLMASQFYTRKQKSTSKLHSYRKQKQKLKILTQNKKKKQLNCFHNKKMLQQINNPLSSLGQLVNQILNLPNQNQVQIPKQLGINKVKLTGQQTKTILNQKKVEEKQKKITKKLKVKIKTKFNEICNVEPWQQLSQNNFYQTSKFLYNSINQQEN